VNEEETEASAATPMGSALSPPPSFRADHPFIFFIQDAESGTILFMGRVLSPSQEENEEPVRI
jgi:serine protease inhibitor